MFCLFVLAVHVSPTLIEPNKPTDPTLGKLVFLVLLCTIATLIGPIIGGIIGVIVLLGIVTLCVVVIGVIYYRGRKVHKRTRLPLAVHYGEYNIILDWLKCYDH